MSVLDISISDIVETVKAAEASVGCGGTPFVAVLRSPSGEFFVGESTHASLEGADSHAEHKAVEEVKRVEGSLPTGATMFTFARPCPSCVSYLLREGIDKIVFVVGSDEVSEYGLLYPAHIPNELLQAPNHPSLGAFKVLEAWSEAQKQ